MNETKSAQWKIVMLPRVQMDTVVSCFLLTYFGEDKFPGIANAEYLFLIDVPQGKKREDLEKEGYIFMDMGGGIFDHHITPDGAPVKCVSEIIAEYLGVQKNRALKKLLDYAHRDDIQGKGTLSEDMLDRAFGLSGLLNNLNRTLPDDQEAVVRTLMPLLLAHYLEEKKRTEDFPKEYAEKIASGKITKILADSPSGSVRIIMIETDEIGMAGYLRAKQDIRADVVVQKMSSGHVNIITQQKKNLDLSGIVRLLRKAELRAKGSDAAISEKDLTLAGRIDGVEEWFFDTRAKTIQNGGVRPQGTTPTRLSLSTIGSIIREGLVRKS
jgi:hypothetical protein